MICDLFEVVFEEERTLLEVLSHYRCPTTNNNSGVWPPIVLVQYPIIIQSVNSTPSFHPLLSSTQCYTWPLHSSIWCSAIMHRLPSPVLWLSTEPSLSWLSVKWPGFLWRLPNWTPSPTEEKPIPSESVFHNSNCFGIHPRTSSALIWLKMSILYLWVIEIPVFLHLSTMAFICGSWRFFATG